MFPTTVAQYGLGCWDLFLETGNNEYWRGAEAAARWLLEHVDSRGGWDASAGLQRGYSAMTQGEAASLLIRVGIRTKNHNYICVAERALELLLQKREDGGTARQEGLDIFLEEDPTGKHQEYSTDGCLLYSAFSMEQLRRKGWTSARHLIEGATR